MKKYKTYSEYIKAQPRDIQIRLKKINDIVKKLSPRAVLSISYGMPGYKLHNKPLVYFAAFAKHTSLFPFPSTLDVFKNLTKNYKTSKGTIQFQNNEKLPVGLITKIVKYRVKKLSEGMCSRGHKFVRSKEFPVCPKCWPGKYKK